MFPGMVIILFSFPLYFFSTNLALLLFFVGILIILIDTQKKFAKNIEKKRSIKKYQEIKFDQPTADKTLELSKNFDISPNINSHKVWLIDAVEALEKQYRKSKSNMFLHNRNRTAAKHPYIILKAENMNYKKNQDYEKLFYKNGNYNRICHFLKRSTISSLDKELDVFTKLIEKQENNK